MNFRQIRNSNEMKWNYDYLVGTISSGDHPIAWDVLQFARTVEMGDSEEWIFRHSSGAEECIAPDLSYVYELPRLMKDLGEG